MMDVGRALKLAWRWTVSLCFGFAWCTGTVWLGARSLWRLGVALGKWRELCAETLPCDRGHPVPMYGVFDCACGSLHEGHVFGRCRVCGHGAGWTPCPECGLPVVNPLRP